MNEKPTNPGEVTEDDMMGPPLIENPDRAELEAKLTEAEDRALRAMAETENVRRRAERDVIDAHKYGIKKLLEELIPVLDSLEQSLTTVTVQDTDDALVKNMREGMALTLQMLQKALNKFGVKEINPINEPFNPIYHEVMVAQPSTDVAPNTITAVLQKGYQLHERVIRPARVMIAKANA